MTKSCSACQHWFRPNTQEPCESCGNKYLNFVPMTVTPMPDEPELISFPQVVVTRPDITAKAASALNTQVGGDHYKKYKIQPIEFIHGNNVDFLAANVIKYIVRHKDKAGAADVRKAMHYCQLILELEYGERG